MSLAYCPDRKAFFCASCAVETKEVWGSFWTWKYYFLYRSPWSGSWQPALDRLEYEGRHPLQQASQALSALEELDQEPNLIRYPVQRWQWPADEQVTDADAQANWNRNAQRWHARYDADGDRNRRYHSDKPLLEMLGEVLGLQVLDAGSGNGYLCRKLAKQGAAMTGVELSDQFLALAREQEAAEPLGIDYQHGSLAAMDFIPSASFDKVVSNYVLMDVPDLMSALAHIHRVLKPGGVLVSTISHPCFTSGPGGWVMPAPDTPRRDDWYAHQVDDYFKRGPRYTVWAEFDPVLGFHRPLRDYWHAFTEIGFTVEEFEEPSITARGRRELPPSRILFHQRTTYSCIFKCRKGSKPAGSKQD